MVVLNKIYTRTGDDGTTALGTGERRKKYDLRIAAYGTLDEANAAIGIARLYTAGDAALDPALARIQNDLFDAGADLATPGKGKGPGGARLTVTDAQVTWLESEIDRLNAELEPLRSFVLPGGSEAAAYLHLARTVCRRAERLIAELHERRTKGSRRRCSNTSTGCRISCSSPRDMPTTKASATCFGGRARIDDKLKNSRRGGTDGPARRQGRDRYRRRKRHRPRHVDPVRARRRPPRHRRSGRRRRLHETVRMIARTAATRRALAPMPAAKTASRRLSTGAVGLRRA